MAWGSIEEKEQKRRTDLACWAYAYEFLNISMVSDAVYDAVSKEVDLTISTGNEVFDSFFKEHFDPSTGMWIRQHPDLHKLHALVQYKLNPPTPLRLGKKKRKKHASS